MDTAQNIVISCIKNIGKDQKKKHKCLPYSAI